MQLESLPGTPGEEAIVRRDLFGRIAAGIAHDFRNPLGVMLNSIYLLRRGGAGASPRDTEILNTIESEIRDMNAYLGVMVDLAARDAAKEHVNVETLLDAARQELKVAAGVNIAVESTRRPLILWADEAQLRHVLQTVLERFGRRGNVSEPVRVVLQADGDLDLLFIRRVEPGSLDPGKSGKSSPSLALLLCEEILERHGGTFRFDASPGRMCAEIRIPSAATRRPAASEGEVREVTGSEPLSA